MKSLNFKKIGYVVTVVMVALSLQGFMDGFRGQFYDKWADQLYVSGDYEGAFEKYKSASELDDGYACYQLYFLYNSGKGVQKDKKLALEMLTKAASLGYTDAEVLLASKLIIGKDSSRAVELLKNAANKNSVSAFSHLSLIYFYGKGVEKNLEEAQKYVDLANKNGANISLPINKKTSVNKKEQLHQVQIGLKKLGFYKGDIDGKISPKMKKAVNSFLEKKKYQDKDITLLDLLQEVNRANSR